MLCWGERFCESFSNRDFKFEIKMGVGGKKKGLWKGEMFLKNLKKEKKMQKDVNSCQSRP